MKKRLFCIIAAAVLLAGCGGAPESSDMSEKPEHTTIATTTAATTTTAAATSATEPIVTEQSGGVGLSLDGVVLTDELKELKRLVSGAKEFCEFEELGVSVTKSTDFAKQAAVMGAQNEDFAPDYDERDFGIILGYDDGNVYFSQYTRYGKNEYEYINPVTGEIMAIYGQSTSEYRYDYFCLDCDSGELTQIYYPEPDYVIKELSNEAMLILSGSTYKLVHRESGTTAELPENMINYVLIDDKLFYELYDSEPYETFTIAWCEVTEDRANFFNSSIYPSSLEPFYITRGVRNIVYYAGGAEYGDLLGKSYICSDPLDRIQDFVVDTYYQGTAMKESNILGWRTRLSIIDRNNVETVLGYVQTEEKPTLGVDVNIHATKDGIIFLQLPDTQPIILLGEENDFSNMKAAFLPEDILPKSYSIYCDDYRLYFYYYGDNKELVTLSREALDS